MPSLGCWEDHKQVGHDKCYSNSPVCIYYQMKASHYSQFWCLKGESKFYFLPYFYLQCKATEGNSGNGGPWMSANLLIQGGHRERISQRRALGLCISCCLSSSRGPFPAGSAEHWSLHAQHRCAFYFSSPFSRNSQRKRGAPRNWFLIADIPGQLVKKKKKKR